MSSVVGSDYPCGTYLSYQHNPCRCAECRAAWNVYQQKLQLRNRRGEVWADADHYRELLAPFCEAKVSPTAIYRVTGLRQKAVRDLMHGTGRVRKGPAERLDGLTFDLLDDQTMVDADILREVVAQLADRVVLHADMARALGWSGWPGPDWPRGKRAQLGAIRTLRRLLVEVDSRCDDCGGPAPEGCTWCWPCFQRRSLPQTKAEIEVAARRERARLKRARYRQGVAA